MVRLRPLLLVCAVVGALVLSVGSTAVADTGAVAFGTNTADAPGRSGSAIDDFTAKTGRAPAIVMWYQSFGEPLFYASQMPAVDGRGAVPMITWEPTGGDAGLTLRTIASGDQDIYLRGAAADAKRWGKPFYVRFAHEMNGSWYSWGDGVGGNTPDDYVAAWRHVVQVFRDAGATNVKWVWSPNTSGYGVARFENYYPGDAWVDWVALDGYNWGSTMSSGWRSFGQVFGDSYRALMALTNKPIMIAEVGSAEQGGDKAAWVRQGLMHDLPIEMPAVRAVVWFDRLKETDWRVDSSPATLASFRLALGASSLGLDSPALLSIGDGGGEPGAVTPSQPVAAPQPIVAPTVSAQPLLEQQPQRHAPAPLAAPPLSRPALAAPAASRVRRLKLKLLSARVVGHELRVVARLSGADCRCYRARLVVRDPSSRSRRTGRMARRATTFSASLRVRSRRKLEYEILVVDAHGTVVASTSRRPTSR